MKPPVLIGLVVGVAIAAGTLFLPRAFPARPERQSAHELAELARRQVHAVGSRVSRLEGLVDIAKLKEADVDRLVTRAASRFDALPAEFTEAISAATRKDAGNRMRSSIQAPGVGAAGIRKAISDTVGQLAADEKLLSEAEKNARQAVNADRDSVQAQQVLGMVQLLRASVLFGQAQVARRDLEVRRAHLLMLGARYRYAKGNIDHFASLDVRDAVENLRKDLIEIEAYRAEATSEVGAMRAAVDERLAALESVTRDLEVARRQLERLESTGFTPGNDGEFNAFRTQFLELTRRMQALQQQEELLRHGGIADAEFAGGEVIGGALTGSDATVALDELERRLESAKIKADGYARSKAEMEKQIGLIEVRGQTTGDAEKSIQAQLAALTEEIKGVQEQVGKLLSAAFDKESSALAAAQSAASSFKSAETSARNWKNVAGTIRSESDPDGKNLRLAQISKDEFVSRIGGSAAAEAQLLAGHIHARRIDDTTRHIALLERLAEMIPGSSVNTETLDAVIKTARDEGQKALDEAKAAYGKLNNEMGMLGWVPQAGLATAHYLLGRIDRANAAEHFRAALDAINKAVEHREQSPYLTTHVVFRDHLRDLAATKGLSDANESQP